MENYIHDTGCQMRVKSDESESRRKGEEDSGKGRWQEQEGVGNSYNRMTTE